MAESIIIHFSNSEIEKVIEIISEIGERIGDSWFIPSNADYRVLIYPYENYFSEYEESERLEVEEKLGCRPEFSYCLELRRSVQNEACDLSKTIIANALLSFDFVVDDCLNKVWTKMEIWEYENKFLGSYYY